MIFLTMGVFGMRKGFIESLTDFLNLAVGISIALFFYVDLSLFISKYVSINTTIIILFKQLKNKLIKNGETEFVINEKKIILKKAIFDLDKIGKINTGNEEVHGEFIGMIKLSNRGTEIFKEHYHRLKKLFWIKSI